MIADEETLWREWRATGDHYFRDELVSRHLGYARSLARRKVIPPHVDFDDIESAAMTGLLHAVERYDPALRSIDFRSFARKRIHGAMQDRLRQLCLWDRRLRKARLEINLESWHRFGTARPNPAARLEREESCERVYRLFCKDEREREILHLYYLEQLPFRRIGELLSLSESRVCHIVGRIVRRDRKSERRHCRGRLTIPAEKVTEIRDLYAAGGVTIQDVADRHGVSFSYAWRLICGLARAEVSGKICAPRSRRVWRGRPALPASEIRKRYARGDVQQKDLAREYGVSPSRISQILAGGVRSGKRRRPSRVAPEYVAHCREELSGGGVTRKELAARLGISPGHLSKLLRRRA